MGLVSGLSLVNHSDSESLLVVHALFSQDGCRREGFWEVVGHVVLFQPRFPGNRLTQKDNADSGVQFITPAGPRQSLLLAKDPVQHL